MNSNGLRQSQLFTKTRREAPADELAKNAQLLIRAGFVYKEMAGVYAYLPLGIRVVEKIKQIVNYNISIFFSTSKTIFNVHSKKTLCFKICSLLAVRTIRPKL
jgi:prolyl-tRNA synthetase